MAETRLPCPRLSDSRMQVGGGSAGCCCLGGMLLGLA
jgi:hypothetical protein